MVLVGKEPTRAFLREPIIAIVLEKLILHFNSGWFGCVTGLAHYPYCVFWDCDNSTSCFYQNLRIPPQIDRQEEIVRILTFTSVTICYWARNAGTVVHDACDVPRSNPTVASALGKVLIVLGMLQSNLFGGRSVTKFPSQLPRLLILSNGAALHKNHTL